MFNRPKWCKIHTKASGGYDWPLFHILRRRTKQGFEMCCGRVFENAEEGYLSTPSPTMACDACYAVFMKNGRSKNE